MNSEIDDPIATIRSTIFLATEIAWRLTDVMVAKGILNKGEANSTLYAIADGIRQDADGTSSENVTSKLARELENMADQAWPRK